MGLIKGDIYNLLFLTCGLFNGTQRLENGAF